MTAPRKVIAIILIGVTFAGAGLVLIQDQRRMREGRELAAQYCSTCHLEPAPEILPKRSWVAALGYMGYWLGIQNTDYLDEESTMVQANVRRRLEYLERDKLVPPAPILDDEEWETLRHYYIESAPATAIPQIGKPALQWELPQFSTSRSNYQPPLPITTLVHIRESMVEVYIGDSGELSLTILDRDGRIKVAS